MDVVFGRCFFSEGDGWLEEVVCVVWIWVWVRGSIVSCDEVFRSWIGVLG